MVNPFVPNPIVQRRDYLRIPKNIKSLRNAQRRAVTIGDHIGLLFRHYPACWLTPAKVEYFAKEIWIEMIGLNGTDEELEHCEERADALPPYHLFVEYVARAFARIGRG